MHLLGIMVAGETMIGNQPPNLRRNHRGVVAAHGGGVAMLVPRIGYGMAGAKATKHHGVMTDGM